MKTLLLIRHGKSSWSDPELSDRERPLKERGRRDARLIAEYLRGAFVAQESVAQESVAQESVAQESVGQANVDQAYSSPARRAADTAAIIVPELGVALQWDEQLYTFDEQALLHWLQGLDNQLQTVLAFGHNPAITELVNFVAGTTIDNIPTCGLARLDFALDSWEKIEQGTATLSDLVTAKQLRK